MEEIENPPQVGNCSYCHRPSIRLLNAPLLRIPAQKADTWWGDISQVKFNAGICNAVYEVVERECETLVVLAAEASLDRRYCFKCFDGHLSPDERMYCINMPREMHFTPDHPWWRAKWVSIGREHSRH